MSVRYRLITANELDSTLIDTWRAIQSKYDVFESPYFSPEFTQLVGQVRNDVRIVVIENDRRAVGFFPHQRSFNGMGKPVGGPLSDYHGVIAWADSEWEIGPLMRAANLSVLVFDHLIGNTQKFDPHVISRVVSPQIDLSSGYEQYVQEKCNAGSDYIRKTETLARKLAREIGELHFTLHESGNDVIMQLIEWKRSQYQRANLTDAFEVTWTGNLLRRISQTKSTGFAGVCSVLRVGDRIAAIHLGMRSTSVLHYWFPAYDPEFGKFSTGIILLLRIAKTLADSGMKAIDLGKGESQYKSRLMTRSVEIMEGYIELPSLLTTARRLRRTAESYAASNGRATILKLPFRAIRRFERTRRFR